MAEMLGLRLRVQFPGQSKGVKLSTCCPNHQSICIPAAQHQGAKSVRWTKQESHITAVTINRITHTTGKIGASAGPKNSSVKSGSLRTETEIITYRISHLTLPCHFFPPPPFFLQVLRFLSVPLSFPFSVGSFHWFPSRHSIYPILGPPRDPFPSISPFLHHPISSSFKHFSLFYLFIHIYHALPSIILVPSLLSFPSTVPPNSSILSLLHLTLIYPLFLLVLLVSRPKSSLAPPPLLLILPFSPWHKLV